jgi:hypothetical protein
MLVCMYMHMYVCIVAHIACLYICMKLPGASLMYVCMYVRTYARMYVCMYVCMCIYIAWACPKHAACMSLSPMPTQEHLSSILLARTRIRMRTQAHVHATSTCENAFYGAHFMQTGDNPTLYMNIFGVNFLLAHISVRNSRYKSTRFARGKIV